MRPACELRPGILASVSCPPSPRAGSQDDVSAAVQCVASCIGSVIQVFSDLLNAVRVVVVVVVAVSASAISIALLQYCWEGEL